MHISFKNTMTMQINDYYHTLAKVPLSSGSSKASWVGEVGSWAS